jgi:branched-chain amino acid transport system ATP-binding protein
MSADTALGAGGIHYRGAARLQVEGLSMRFGGLRVFEDLRFGLDPGETLGVIGPNGAGKTTLINVLCGLLVPTGGRVSLGERDITRLSFHARSRGGLVRSFQQTNTFKPATVRENVARALAFSGGPAAIPPALARLLEEFDLTDRLDEPSDKLPYGLQKMLGLALVYATRPGMLLLDEPAAGLEHKERHRIDQFIRSVQRDFGCGVLIVEHDMDLIRRLCGRIIVLDAGALLAEGVPAEVLERREVVDAYLGVGVEE